MKIEHTAYQVADPPAVARWYVEHLGLTIKRSQDASPFGCFLADQGDAVMLEFYRQPHLPVPDYYSVNSLIMHLAFWADDVPGKRARLLAAGATAEGDVIKNDQGDEVAMLRDPWGLPVQLVRRERAMLASCRS